ELVETQHETIIMDDDEAFNFGGSNASVSLQTHNEIWTDIKHICREIGKSKGKRGPALIAFKGMITSLKHQQVLHASGTWSFVIAALVQVLDEDVSAIVKKKSIAKKEIKLDLESMMNDLLDYAHTHTSPASSTAVLDRDSVGLKTLRSLVSSCGSILAKPSLENTAAEASAFRIVDKLFKFRAYCRAVSDSHLKMVLEKSLYLMNDRTAKNALVASKIALNILTYYHSDLHPKLPELMEYFHQWFLHASSDGNSSRKSQSTYATNMPGDTVLTRNVLSCMVLLMQQYGPHVTPFLSSHQAMSYVQRHLNDEVLALSQEPAEFLIMYYRLVHASAAPRTSVQNRQLKQLHASCVLDDKILTNIVRHIAHNATNVGVMEKSYLWLSVVADVVFYMDQWGELHHQHSVTKRRRHMTDLETIVGHLQGGDHSIPPVLPVSQMSSTQHLKGMTLARLHWLMLVQALLARHGHWLVGHHLESLQALANVLIQSLNDATMDGHCKEQTLHCLLALALYMRPQDDPTRWRALWQTLVSDFSIRNMTKCDVVLQLLSALVALEYVPMATLERDLGAILTFPAFASPSVYATLLLYLIQTKVDTDVCDNAWTRQEVAAYYMSTLAHQIFAPDGLGHAAPVLVAAIGSVFSDGRTFLDCTPYLVSSFWVGCVTCDLPPDCAKSFSKRDADLFEVPPLAHLSSLAGYFARHSRTKDSPSAFAASRIAFPPYVQLKITLEPAAYLTARRADVMYSTVKSQSGRSPAVVLDEMHRLLTDVVEKCDTSSSDQHLVYVEALMNVGVVIAGVLDVYCLDANVLMKNVLTAVWSRMSKWMASPNAVGLLHKLLCMLQLLGRSVSVDSDGKGKFPPSCRPILSFIGTNVEEFITNRHNADVPDVDDDDIDTSRWASLSQKHNLSRLCCLRIHHLMQFEHRRTASMSSQSAKQEDTSQLIRLVVEQTYMTASECLALVPSLWRPLTNEGLSTIVFLLLRALPSHPVDVCQALEGVAAVVSRQQIKSASASYDLGLVLDALLKLRKPRKLRRALVLAYEQLFVMDVDQFVQFSDFMMASLCDQDIQVQVASISVLQSAYAKYDEGVVAIFNDVEALLKEKGCHRFVSALACFISAASADILVSRVLALYSSWFDTDPELFQACTVALAQHFAYPSPLAMLEDVCWSTLCHYVELGPQLHAKRDVWQFPMALFGAQLPRLADSSVVPSILTLLVLLDEANTDIHRSLEQVQTDVPNLAAIQSSVRVILAWARRLEPSILTDGHSTLVVLQYMMHLNAYDPELYPLHWPTLESMVRPLPVNVVDVVLAVHAWLKEHKLESFASEPIKFLCDAVDALSKTASNGHALSHRIVLHVLVQHVDRFDVAGALKRVCDLWMTRDPDLFGQNLNHLIRDLVRRYAALPVKVQEVVEDIAHAIARVPKLGKFLATLDPFPSQISPGLNQLQRSHNVDEPVMIQTLAGKLTRPPLQSTPLTMETLLSLQDIVAANTDDHHIPTIVHGLLSNTYQVAVREADSAKQVQLATCVGLIGAVFPADLLSHDVARLDVLYLHLFARPSLAALSQAKDPWLELVGKLLECLLLLLFDSNGRVVHTAHDTLKALLQLNDIHSAVNHMKSHAHGPKAFLQSFFPADTTVVRALPTRRTTVPRWAPVDHPSFRHWICHICSVLLMQSPDPILGACVDVCSVNDRLAIFLLPMAIYSILGTDAPDLQRLEQLILQDATSLPPDHGQVLVQTINYVRHLQTMKSGQSVWALPYMQVAELALRCKMPYSALQYVELHLEHTVGTIAPDQALAPGVANILLQAYKQVNALDAIDGVRQVGHSLSDQLTMYTLENKYSDCLPLYDVLARQKGAGYQKGIRATAL
ncbi:hypothetical protein DYB36_004627, partial [Aphanomyces astaci]